MKFSISAKDPHSSARCGSLETAHGTVHTPIFMPVGTVGSVKGVYHRDLKDDIRAEIILGNTYHLYLRPGLDTLRAAGGLHKFESWDRPILTDSGGFQVFSLSPIRKLTPEGCTFRSHIDGSRHVFTPENNVDTQRIIGADIMMALDECCPGDADHSYARRSLDLTKSWLERYAARFRETEPLYGYDQCFFPPEDRPRYLMGVGTPANILEGIERGVDMFDCVMPTRNGRNGMLFTWNGIMNMRNAKWAQDFSEVDPDGASFVDHNYSKAYLHHLFIAGEMFAAMLASEHNLAFYLDLVRTARRHIEAGDYAEWKKDAVARISSRI